MIQFLIIAYLICIVDIYDHANMENYMVVDDIRFDE